MDKIHLFSQPDADGCHMDMRELKALEIAARCQDHLRRRRLAYPLAIRPRHEVPRDLGAAPSCTCEDFRCVSSRASTSSRPAWSCARDYHGAEPKIVTDAVPNRPTYKQDWPAYNHAQETEKDRFQELLFDLTRGLADPPRAEDGPQADADSRHGVRRRLQGLTRPLQPRRFGCDLKDAHEKGYLSDADESAQHQRLPGSPELTAVLQTLIVRSSLPLKTVETVFAPDCTGFYVTVRPLV